MELLSNALAHHSVPDRYVFPPDKRPVPLSERPQPRRRLPRHRPAPRRPPHLRPSPPPGGRGDRQGRQGVQLLPGGEPRHGGGRGAGAPAEDKLPCCSYDMSKRFRLTSSTSYDHGETRYWRDYIKFPCYPASDENARHWPSKPSNLTPSLVEYSTAVHELAQTILCLIAEGLGLDGSFFTGDLSGGDTHISVNYYPPCPDPTVTMGLLAHCDRHLLTVFSQADVQARHGDRWLLVHPIPSAFVVNFGHQMEIVTNGVLASVEHRSVTNSAVARIGGCRWPHTCTPPMGAASDRRQK
ncbi:hypothetical protein CFC21_081652 [Triticum aestivum]|uniref:Fe2OG dioxygenase domain-containing protein n=2 Tax=Triticum aestivum TaxID=4565 RepID=A0A9R1I4W5_WHEAT|nr:hypothetical protein CFC21_081652 [Triticum aestivum]